MLQVFFARPTVSCPNRRAGSEQGPNTFGFVGATLTSRVRIPFESEIGAGQEDDKLGAVGKRQGLGVTPGNSALQVVHGERWGAKKRALRKLQRAPGGHVARI